MQFLYGRKDEKGSKKTKQNKKKTHEQIIRTENIQAVKYTAEATQEFSQLSQFSQQQTTDIKSYILCLITLKQF